MAILCQLTLAVAVAFAVEEKEIRVYDVTTFGAKGDGVADDTQAIQAAVNAANKDPATTSIPFPGTAYYGITPEVIFSAGTYRITAPIILHHYNRLRGEGNAAIKPDKPDQDIIVIRDVAWRNQISGLCFLGGARAIVICTKNLDSADILIRNCQFYGSNRTAIYCEDNSNSTLLKITDCQFLNCEQVLRNTCDMVAITDCWITTRKEMKNKAVFENRSGWLMMERIVGVPQVVSANDQRWIDNYGSVTCRDFRFGGEDAGMPAVFNYKAYSRNTYPILPNSITLDDCPLFVAGNRIHRAAIYCFEVPNMITIRNCQGVIDAPLVKLDKKIDPNTYFADALKDPRTCRYLLRDNSVDEIYAMADLPWQMRQLASVAPGPINVKEFNARGNGTDDTAALQMAFDYAAAAGLPVVIPRGQYLITKPIEVKVAEVRGESRPTLIAKDNAKNFDLLYAPNAHLITIEGIAFQGGRDQVSLGNENIDTSQFVVRNCNFEQAGGVAVHFRKGSNSTIAKVEQCRFMDCEQTFINYCDWAALRDCWISTSAAMRDKAVIVNSSGNLTCENIVGVPRVNGSDQRWIDNYSTLICRNFRFGGESGGFTPVVNFAPLSRRLCGPSVIIENSCLFGLGNARRVCGVSCEEIPNLITVRNCQLGGIPPVQVSPKIDLKQYFDGVPDGLLTFDLATNQGETVLGTSEALLKAAADRSRKKNYGDKQLSAEETARRLAVAVEAAKKLPDLGPSVVTHAQSAAKGRKQQTNPARFIDLGPSHYQWDLEDTMDGTGEKNSEYLAVAEAGNDIVLLRRQDAGEGWPHVRVRNVKLDLSKTPWLTWRNKDNGLKGASYAVKVVDKATGQTAVLLEIQTQPYFDYQAYDLRKIFGYAGGEHTFDIKFYFLGLDFSQSATQPHIAKKGDSLVIDFLRAEAE